MSTITITYQPGRDNFELHTPGTIHVLTPIEAEKLAHSVEHAVNQRRLKRRLEASSC